MRETWELLPLLHRMSLSRKSGNVIFEPLPPIRGSNFKQDALGNRSTPNIIRTVHILRCEGGFHPIIFRANAEGEASGARGLERSDMKNGWVGTSFGVLVPSST